MKKIIFIFFLMILSFLNSKTIFAFWVSSDSEKWFYSSIADNVDKMEEDLFKIDIVWEEWTKEKINKQSENNCIKENLSVEEIKFIATEWKIDVIKNKIDKSCINEDWSINQNTLISLIESIWLVANEYSNQAKEKTNQIFNLGSTWIYADWFEWNSPFDLIVDLQNIDSIIFMEDSTVYEWNTDLDLAWEISNLIDNANELNRTPLDILNLNIINENNSNSNKEFDNLKTFDEINSQSVYSSYLCSIANSNSWLNENSLNFLNSDSKIDEKNIDTWTGQTSPKNENEIKTKKELEKKALQMPFSEYSKVTDNSQFPCNTFFCIDIKFITYNHLLLWGWFQDISIEYLINRSNDHLKKFTNTSLVGSKMTINNFELWLKDLNLPDIFHIWVQISQKPIPMLNIVKEDKKEWDDLYSTENQLKFYYESNWLEYKRRNDLSIFKNVDTDKQIALNSSLLNTSQYLDNIPAFNNYQKDKQKQKELMSKLIENEVKTWIMSDFETQFKELEVFNAWIKNYIENLNKIYSNMLKIPEGS